MSVPVWCVDITCVVMYLMVCTRFECLDVFFFFNYVVVVVADVVFRDVVSPRGCGVGISDVDHVLGVRDCVDCVVLARVQRACVCVFCF